MPVDLREIPSVTYHRMPGLPGWMWVVMALVFVGAGAALAVWCWPAGHPTATLDFWCWVTVVPLLAFACLYMTCDLPVVYVHGYAQRLERVRAEVVDSARRFAQEPLSVLATAYTTAMGCAGVAARVVAEESAPDSMQTSEPGHHVIDSASTQEEMITARIDAALQYLIDALTFKINQLPPGMPLNVRLVIPQELDGIDVQGIWHGQWQARQLMSSRVEQLVADEGDLMALDRWLDAQPGRELKSSQLWIVLHLARGPVAQSAECALGLLLGWPDTAVRYGVESVAALHRPVRSPLSDLALTIATAQDWGKSRAGEIVDVWYCGGSSELSSALLRDDVRAALGKVPQSGDVILHSVDASLGRVSAVSGWLGLALAAEYAQQCGAPQLLLNQQHDQVIACVIRASS